MSNSKLNILFLSSWYPNRVYPSLGNFVQKHVEAVALNANVAALNVISDVHCKTKYEIVESNLNGVYTVNVYFKKAINIPIIKDIIRANRYVNGHFKGLKLVRKHFGKIDLVHHNILYPAGIIAWYLKKFKGVPYIITENWTGYLPSKRVKLSFLQIRLSKMIARNAACITPVSKDLKEAMISFGFKSKYEVIYNVVNIHLFHPLKDKQADRKIKFLHVSTLDDPHKNISGMLRVIAELSKVRKDFEFWFVGEGDTKSYIELANNLGIYKSFVFFDGTKTTVEVADLMRSADCFVMFSNYENLPCVIIEALASGIPVVSSTAGGVPEHIKDSMGILVKPTDEKNLLVSLIKAMDNIYSHKYSAEELNRYANDNFSYEKVSEKFITLYKNILADKK